MEQKKRTNVVKNLLNYATIVLIALRACDVIAWSWYVVLSLVLAKFALFLAASIVIDYILLKTGKMSAFYMNRFVLLQINS